MKDSINDITDASNEQANLYARTDENISTLLKQAVRRIRIMVKKRVYWFSHWILEKTVVE